MWRWKLQSTDNFKTHNSYEIAMYIIYPYKQIRTNHTNNHDMISKLIYTHLSLAWGRARAFVFVMYFSVS